MIIKISSLSRRSTFPFSAVLCVLLNFSTFSVTPASPTTPQCRSYGKQLGSCVAITRCPRLLAILLSSDRTVQDLRMLQKLTCITEISDLEKEPVVCCPLREISDYLVTPQYETGTSSGSMDRAQSRSTSSQRPPTKSTPASTPEVVSPNEEDLLQEKIKLLPGVKDCSNAITSERIIGGETVSHGVYPWQARLGYRHKGTGRLEYYCGGSVINKRYVLTAGHCTQGFDDNFILSEVRLGEHDTTTDLDCNEDLGNLCSSPEDFKVERIITHPHHNTGTKQNDIALLRLNQDISFSSYFVQPICLPFFKEFNLLEPDYEDFTATVAGWGRQLWNKTRGSPQLLHVSVPLVSNSKCQQLYRRRVTITNKQLCAGGVLGKDSCSGDSGGALMGNVPIPNKLPKIFQIGIVSFGQIQCGGPLPGVYTRVKEYLSWILANIEP